MSFIETIKNLLKASQQKTDEEEKKEEVTEETSTPTYTKDTVDYKKFIDTVKSYKNEEERISSISDVKYEEKVYTPVSDEELKKIAENELYGEYSDKQQALNDKKSAQIEGYQKDAEKLQEQSKTQKSQIEGYYNQALEGVSNDAIKRGLQRSSIVSEQVNRLNQNEVNDLISVDNNLKKDLQEIENDIKKAETDYLNAVKELDFKKAVEVSDRVNSLKEKEDKKRKEIDEINAKMLEEVNKSNEILNKDKTSQLTINRRNMINEVLNYFYSLPKDVRYKAFIEDDELISLLGEDASYVEKYLK